MHIPTAIATQLAADNVARRRGAATLRLSLPKNPLAGLARSRMARRAAPCATC